MLANNILFYIFVLYSGITNALLAYKNTNFLLNRI